MRSLVKLSLLAAVLTISACAFFKSKPPTKEVTQESRPQGKFTQLSVKGDINLNINSNQRQSLVVLEGYRPDIAQIKTEVKNDTLIITAERGHPRHGPVNVIVDTRYLHRLSFEGKGKVYANHLNTRILDVKLNSSGTAFLKGKIGLRELEVRGNANTTIEGIDSKNLDIVMFGSPRVNLSGMANLKRLNFSGSGWLGLYWVNSPKLTIKGKGTAYAQLAGTVGILHMDLDEGAHMNGKYLRIDKAFVKTHDQAIAEIQVLKSQNTLASDQSNIFYYNDPESKANFMAYNGAILDMNPYA